MSVPLPPNDPLLGTLALGRYRIVRTLGEGGMGRVYVAEHTALQKLIAIKVLREEFTNRGDIVTRFQQEAISASRIKHPNVLEVFDFGRLENGSFFLAMELLEGRDLARELRRVRTLDVLTGLRVAFQICSALGAAHGRGVVHRDLKPENVFLQHIDAGVVATKIVDFGIAQLRDDVDRPPPDSDSKRLTKAGTILGTPEYMAPEQGAGRRADHRADVYALGVILYEMFTGRVPFSGPSFLDTLAKHQNEPPPPIAAAVSRELQAVILRALAKDPADRFQRMSDFERALGGTPEGGMAARQAARSRSFTPIAQGPSSNRPSHPPETPRRRTPEPLRAASPPRVETPIATEAAITRSVPPAGKRLAVASLIAMGAAVLGVIAAQVSSLSSPPASARAAAPVASETLVPSPADGDIDVVTIPAQATLKMNGAVVCAQTPCRISARAGERIDLEATKGRLRGGVSRTVRPGETVSIELAEGAVRLCNVEVDGVWHGPCDP